MIFTISSCLLTSHFVRIYLADLLRSLDLTNELVNTLQNIRNKSGICYNCKTNSKLKSRGTRFKCIASVSKVSGHSVMIDRHLSNIPDFVHNYLFEKLPVENKLLLFNSESVSSSFGFILMEDTKIEVDWAF